MTIVYRAASELLSCMAAAFQRTSMRMHTCSLQESLLDERGRPETKLLFCVAHQFNLDDAAHSIRRHGKRCVLWSNSIYTLYTCISIHTKIIIQIQLEMLNAMLRINDLSTHFSTQQIIAPRRMITIKHSSSHAAQHRETETIICSLMLEQHQLHVYKYNLY